MALIFNAMHLSGIRFSSTSWAKVSIVSFLFSVVSPNPNCNDVPNLIPFSLQ